MDPQGRILLEQSGLALAHANARLEEPVVAHTGVYVGVMHMEYIQYMTGAHTCIMPFSSSSPVATCSTTCLWHVMGHISQHLSIRIIGELNLYFPAAGLGVQVTPNVSTGNGMDFLVGRLSYTFGLTGPCVSTHTACSSSLVSTHLAVHGLTAHDCEAALSAGVFLVLLSGTMAGICQLQVGRSSIFPVHEV